MKKNKILLNALVISAGALILTGCGTVKLKNGEKVAISVNGGNITSDSFYKTLRNKYGKSILVDEIDKKIFNEIYKDNKEIESQVDNQLEYIKKQYSDDFEGTLKSAGYDSEDALKDELRLNYQRDKAVSDYVKDSIKEDEIKKYYDEEVVGDISAKHILIKVKSDDDEDGLSDKEALKKAKDIIKKLDKGEDFDKLAKENSDDEGSKEKGGDLGYFNKGDMVEEFENAAYDLKVSEYTKEPVKTTYGYHIILKTGEKDKASYKSLKNDIKEKIKDKKLEEDKTLTVTALDEIRKNYKLKIKDSKLKKLYKEYIEEQIENSKEKTNE
jgi:foldase protein PrsA